ncbi:F-box protein SKIP22-like [Coffea eugenioides]|uniref:F-box protein SKIP22-like n=1 Tax=Coffea eugenioides TaxID=49369 RepID=UPI000F60ABC5|nr:F-box protein SKIP22-like [Coffea eugenioides]
MMKLRIRSFGTKETLRIEVPIPCSLQQLKDIISQTLRPSTSSSPPAPSDSIHLSLNRKEEIQSSSPNEDTLQSLGITSGDLIFYTLDPSRFSSSESLIPNSQEPISSPLVQNSEFPLRIDLTLDSGKPLQKPSSMEPLDPPKITNSDPSSQLKQAHQPESANLNEQNEGSTDYMEFDGIDDQEEGDDASALEAVGNGKSFSVPGFLRKVFTEELGGGDDDGSRNHKLLVIAIHAVLLESGFVGFDMNLKTESKGFPFRNDWPSSGFRLSLFYTLPEIVSDVSPSLDCHNCVVGLKFQNVGKFMMVYGSLNAGSAMHSVRLNEDELVSFLNVVWANCGLGDDIMISGDVVLGASPENEVFKFWRNVKDNLALPLLIDLCESVGLVLPPCFMRLPTDLKLKILESLPGVDIAKVSCVSAELRYLASSDDLWKQKCVEQFGHACKTEDKGPWKEKFARFWESRKRRKLGSRSLFRRPLHPRRILDPIPRFPHWPGIIGGDYDLYPQIPGGARLRDLGHCSRSHVPRCQFGRNRI